MTRYLVTYYRTHAPLGEFMEAILNMWQTNRNFVTGIGIPNSGVEKGFFDSFLRKCSERGVSPPILELKNVFTNVQTQVSAKNKKKRIIAALQPLFQQGKYLIHPDHIEARDELLTIGSSRWDDIVDTMAYAEQIITPMYFGAPKTGFNQPPLMQGRSVDYGIVY